MPAQTPISRRHAIFACVALLVTVVLCAALLTLAVLLHAPPAALPVLLVDCIGGPALAAHELARALQGLGGEPARAGRPKASSKPARRVAGTRRSPRRASRPCSSGCAGSTTSFRRQRTRST